MLTSRRPHVLKYKHSKASYSKFYKRKSMTCLGYNGFSTNITEWKLAVQSTKKARSSCLSDWSSNCTNVTRKFTVNVHEPRSVYASWVSISEWITVQWQSVITNTMYNYLHLTQQFPVKTWCGLHVPATCCHYQHSSVWKQIVSLCQTMTASQLTIL